MQLLYYSPLEVVYLDAAAATLQYIGVCRQSKLKTQWGLQICNIVLTVHAWSDDSFSNNHILYYSVTVYYPIYISIDMLSLRDMRKGTITPRRIIINTPAAGHFFVCLVVNEKKSFFKEKNKCIYFCWKDPTRNLFALLIRIIVNRDNLKKKKEEKKEDFWGNFWISSRVLPLCLSEAWNIMMYVPFDTRSFWWNMYCLYHSVLTIIMKWDEKWWGGGGEELANEKKLDSQTGTFSSTDVYRRISLSCLFWINFIFVIDWGEIELPLFRVLDTPSL